MVTDMTRLRLLISICCALLAVTAGCKGQAVITPEQAMDAVRAFEADNTLELKCWELESDTEGPEWAYEWWYSIQTSDNESASWRVDAVTGEITMSGYSDASDVEWSENSPGPLTQDECRQIAENFARAKYVGFDTIGFQLYREEWEGRGWYFHWRQRVACGAWTPNSVRVRVNGADGRIQSYGCLHDQTPTPMQPQITEQQAVDIVRAATKIGTEYEFTERNEPELEANRSSIWWGFIITGDDAEGQYHDCAATVDAITGEIIYLKCDTGGGFSHTPKSSVIGGDPICIRDLAAKVPGAKVHWLGKDGAKVFVGKERYTLVPGKDTIESTGGTIKLSAKIKLVDGRLMVPSGLLDILKSASAPPKKAPAPAK